MQQDHQALLGLLFQAILSALNLTHRYLFKLLRIRTEVNAYLFIILIILFENKTMLKSLNPFLRNLIYINYSFWKKNYLY